jgi:DNA-directed RNA polymerase subunit RPC12/RpoP
MENELLITQDELKAIKLKDIDNLSDRDCAKIMGISKGEFKEIIGNMRKKIALEISKLSNDELKNQVMFYTPKKEEECLTKCTFRCATCSKIYEIDYTKDEIICPSCMSRKVMGLEESGIM